MNEEGYKDIIESNIHKYFAGIDIKKYHREYECEYKRFDFLIECNNFDIIIECKLQPHYEDKGQLLLYRYLYCNKFKKNNNKVISLLWYLDSFSISKIDYFISDLISIVYKNNIFITGLRMFENEFENKFGKFNIIPYY